MPINKGKSANPNLSKILEGLLEAGIEFILVGGLAAVIQGAPVTTIDVDVVHKQSPQNISKLIDFLKSIEAFHRRLDDKLIEPKERDLSGRGHSFFSTRLGPLDILAVVEEGKDYEDLLHHTIEIQFRGHTLRVLDLEMLIKLKKKSKDPGDKQRLAVFEETLQQMEKDQRNKKD